MIKEPWGNLESSIEVSCVKIVPFKVLSSNRSQGILPIVFKINMPVILKLKIKLYHRFNIVRWRTLAKV